LLLIDSEEAPPVFGGGRGRIGLCGYGRGRDTERERERERERGYGGEREGESDFIPNYTCNPENDGILGFVWVRKRKGHGERERGREVAAKREAERQWQLAE
jgi:hypothetical protein